MTRKVRSLCLACVPAAALVAAGMGPGISPAFGQDSSGMAMQRARAKTLEQEGKGKRPYYTRTFDLSGLPSYQPKAQVSGESGFSGAIISRMASWPNIGKRRFTNISPM